MTALKCQFEWLHWFFLPSGKSDFCLKVKFSMFTSTYSVIHNTAILQPLRPFRTILHVSPHWLPLFSLFYISDCGRKVKVVGMMLYPRIQKFAWQWCQHQMITLLPGFINMLLELPGGNMGGRDIWMMAALLIKLKAAMNMGNLAFQVN